LKALREFDPLAGLPILLELATLAAVAVTGTRAWLRRRKAVAWPSTQGAVHDCRTSRAKYRGWVCILSYSYAAHGEYYSGSQAIKARNEKKADELALLWKGRSVIVRYNASDPALSVLLKDDQVGGFEN